MTSKETPNSYPTQPIVQRGELPDPFVFPGGSRISSIGEWPACADAWRNIIVGTEYGGMPPKPEAVEIETLCHSKLRRWPGAPQFWTYRVHCHGGERPFSFCVQMVFPNAEDRQPAIINGDGCWWYLNEDIARKVVGQGCALVMFNRTEFTEDLGYKGVADKGKRSGGLYDVYPDGTFGAIAGWAWGYHRCVDLLQELPFIDSKRIAVTGHSRGGKTVLLAGATDERITLVNDNASGCGGSSLFRHVGDSGETMEVIVDAFPSWFGTGLQPYIGKEDQIPFDQHCLLASLAPRPLLSTYALDDRWSNPEGMVLSHGAAGEAYRFLGNKDSIAWHFRPGGHAHDPIDWDALLDFIAWKWQGKEPAREFNQHPYGHLKPIFSWKAPGGQPQSH